MDMNYKQLSKTEESIAREIVDAAYTVNKILYYNSWCLRAFVA